jgi:hypothetical protein
MAGISALVRRSVRTAEAESACMVALVMVHILSHETGHLVAGFYEVLVM